MVDFTQLQELVKERLEQERRVQIVTASGGTLEEAVAEAALLLDIPIRKLEYEITERGFPGFMGAGKKKWTVRAYERLEYINVKNEERYTDDDDFEEEVRDDADGDVFIRLTPDGMFLKAIPPRGNGVRASAARAIGLLEDRLVENIDKDLVAQVVRNAAGEFVRIGDYEHRPMNDSTVAVEILEEEMVGCIIVSPPGYGGCDFSVETYITILKNNRVYYGINEDYLRAFVEKPVYKEKVVVAEGLKPAPGDNAFIQYNFETDQSKLKLREGSNGRIDFKEINIIKNVVEKQPLAKKIPAQQGVLGRTVTGKMIPTRDGRDIPLPVGKNVHVGEDGVTIIADISGQVVLAGGKINVEPIYTVSGDVNLKTGNIIFLGTVVISGSVEDGFTVKATGNIEVNGTVGKAELDAEGDIIVHQGITGKGAGKIRAGRSIWARFIENSFVESGNMVVVSDGIINSQVDAFKRIICKGKRAHIVGGRLRASEEINAKILGSPTSGTETICEVGIDPASKMQLETLIEKKGAMEKQLEEVQLNLNTLINIKRQRKTLSEEKEANMGELMDKRQLLLLELKKNMEESQKIQEFLAAIKARGRVSASSKVYPGVKVIIRDVVNEVRTDYKDVTFLLENNLIRVSKYEEPYEDISRGPDGYTAD